MDAITLRYYGHVFDASGYGEAARAYIHALHGAGVSLSVVDLMNHGRQVSDPLIESLMNRSMEPDFHLFHGIPPQWGRLAFPLPNAVGMTVWETDTMPTQWRNILSHCVDVWLPCEFNVETFRRDLDTPIFKLPHPVVTRHVNGMPVELDRVVTCAPADFVFYSIFEWQERKSPEGLLRAYFRAFPEEKGALLVLKVNARAASVAAATIEKLRRETESSARVSLVAEAWTEPQIEALHARGSCYVSLHRGEGWGYPLFDAAARGTPVIATAFSGPLDYLEADAAHLVPFSLVPVRQPYVYYGPQMRWAEPDVEVASRLMQEVHADPAGARERAGSRAWLLRQAYSAERIGAMAKERLMALLERRDRRRWRAAAFCDRPEVMTPTGPIPAEWYDEDYFEHGLKSNWSGGYSWAQLSGLFRDTARFLIDMFPEADSFLDAGCAKGFLVRSLRERGKQCWGFDHSAWAIQHADDGSKPFLIQAAADRITFDRQFDAVLAFDLLSQLTEDQILEFLGRSRDWTRIAIVATIRSGPDTASARGANADRDRSHITVRARDWWHATFLRAGWRQDALHRFVQSSCQRHTVPTATGWQMYVYVPR